MGVDRRDYIVVGVNFESKNLIDYYVGDFDDLCDEYYWREKAGEIVFVDDLYGGKYFIVGEILQSCDGYREGLDYNLFGKEEQIELAKMRVKAFIKKHFNIDVNPSVIIKTQWS